jgi:hypothetical protein
MRRRDQSGRRGDVEDVAAALRTQPRGEHVAAVDRAPQVDADDPRPVVDRDLADEATDGDPGVVDDQVDPAQQAVALGASRSTSSSCYVAPRVGTGAANRSPW